jgi:hypothetical protein
LLVRQALPGCLVPSSSFARTGEANHEKFPNAFKRWATLKFRCLVTKDRSAHSRDAFMQRVRFAVGDRPMSGQAMRYSGEPTTGTTRTMGVRERP